MFSLIYWNGVVWRMCSIQKVNCKATKALFISDLLQLSIGVYATSLYNISNAQYRILTDFFLITCINSLWPCYAICRRRSWSTKMASIHYQNQCLLAGNEVLWYSLWNNIWFNTQNYNTRILFGSCSFDIISTCPKIQWIKYHIAWPILAVTIWSLNCWRNSYWYLIRAMWYKDYMSVSCQYPSYFIEIVLAV